jgi:hypothetical protein
MKDIFGNVENLEVGDSILMANWKNWSNDEDFSSYFLFMVRVMRLVKCGMPFSMHLISCIIASSPALSYDGMDQFWYHILHTKRDINSRGWYIVPCTMG